VPHLIGVLFAGAAVLGGLYFSYQLALQNKNLGAWAAGLAPLAAVAGIFFYDRRAQQREIERKQRAQRT
jgi:hypothetical protein